MRQRKEVQKVLRRLNGRYAHRPAPARALAALLELGGPVARPRGAEAGDQRPLEWTPLEDRLNLLAVLDHGGA
jgi:hypothetical protein